MVAIEAAHGASLRLSMQAASVCDATPSADGGRSASGNGVEMDRLFGRSRAFEVSAATSLDGSTAPWSGDESDPAAAERVFTSLPPAATDSADAATDAQDADQQRAVLVPCLLALLHPSLTQRRRSRPDEPLAPDDAGPEVG